MPMAYAAPVCNNIAMPDDLLDLFSDLDKPPTPLPALLNQVEKHFGKSETYSRFDRELIAEGIIPEWLMRGKQLLKGPDQQRCEKAIDHLKGLHAAVWKQVEFRRDR